MPLPSGEIHVPFDQDLVCEVLIPFLHLRDHVGLSEKAGNTLGKKVFFTMYKLSAVKYHSDNAARHVQGRAVHLGQLSSDLVDETAEELAVGFELESFLMQAKSSLDILAKTLAPILELPEGSLQTFGNSGERILKLLERNVSWQRFNEQHLRLLQRTICEARDKWMGPMIGLRDVISHYESAHRVVLSQAGKDDGLIDAADAVEKMRYLYGELINFHKDFLVNALRCRLPRDTDFRRATEEDKSRLGQIGRFITWTQ